MHNLGRLAALALCATLLAAIPKPSHAFTVSIGGSFQENIYLQIGVGTGGTYTAGTLGNNTTVNTETVTVPASTVGSSTPQAMTTNSTVTTSAYNGRAFCTVPGQLYIGSYYQPVFFGIFGGGSATVTVTVPASLIDGAGDTLAFSSISWTSSGIGDTGAEPFPAGTFAPGTTQTVGTVAANQFAESCWSFSYANTKVLPAGTYSATLTYTATTP